MKSFGATMLEDNIAAAEEMITKWDIHGSSYTRITSLFYDNRQESRHFLRVVFDLHNAMRLLVAHSTTLCVVSKLLLRAHRLMTTAMARLEKEFYQILAANHDRLDSDSISSSTRSDDGESARSVALMDDLRSIADCMIGCGHTKECVKVYVTVRRRVVEDGMNRLGYVRLSSTQFRKLQWEEAEGHIRNWVAASRPAVRTIFAGERLLCNHVFGSSSSKDLVFVEVVREPAEVFFRFPEIAATKQKSSPEKIFHYLDLYAAISELYLEIDSLFSHGSTAAVQPQAAASLAKLGVFIRSSLGDFQSAIEKDWTKTSVPGGGVHPMSRYVMNYLCFLADYTEILGDILEDHPFLPRKPLPEPFLELLTPLPSAPSTPRSREIEEEEELPPPVASAALCTRLAWLVLLLLCKLDKKAEAYSDAALSYMFLANNVRYVVEKVRESNLRHLLGEEWARSNLEKARSFARGYVKLGWRRVVAALPAGTVAVEEAEERMWEFGAALEELRRRQSGWVVQDRWMREEVKVSIAGKVMVPYRKLYDMYVELVGREAVRAVRFTPKDVENYLSDLFHNSPSPSGSTSGSSGSSGPAYGSRSSGSSSSSSGRKTSSWWSV